MRWLYLPQLLLLRHLHSETFAHKMTKTLPKRPESA